MATSVTPDAFFGGSISFGSLSVNSIDIISGGRSAVTGDDIDVSNAQQAVASGESTVQRIYEPSDFVEGGTYDFTVMFDPNDDVDNLVNVKDTNITVTYPTKPSGSSGASVSFEGYINSYSQELPIDDKMTADISIKVAKRPTHTAET